MKHLFLLLLLFWSLAAPTLAQSLDPAFQPTTLLNHSDHVQVLALAAQADGKSLVAGDFHVVGAALSNNIIRLNADRSRDLSFRTAPGASGPVSCVVVQPDGKLLIAGNFAAYAGTTTGPVARLLPNGELDATFQLPSALAGATVNALAVQADGKVLVGGTASAALPGGLVRLLPSGALDASFDVGTGAGSGGLVLTLAVQTADGYIVVGGVFASFGGRASQSLVRLLPNGAPDTSFAPSGLDASAAVCSVALYANGNVLAGGTTSNSLYPSGFVTRRLPTGALDPQFSLVIGNGSYVTRVRIDTNGQALVCGSFDTVNSNGTTYYNNRISVARLLADGSLDPGFVPPTNTATGYYRLFSYRDALPQPDGQVLLGGFLMDYIQLHGNYYGLELVSAAGVLDPSFDLGLQWRGTMSTVTPLASGQLLVRGTYSSLNGQAPGGQLQRLNADGSFDQNVTLPAGIGNVSDIFAQPDGRLYVVGYTSTCRGTDCGLGGGTTFSTYRMYRMATNNSLDTSFTPIELGTAISGMGGKAAIAVQFVLPYPNGDIVLAGQSAGGITVPRQPILTRYLPTGVAASGFTSPALPAWSKLDQALLQPDGTIVVSYHLTTGESQLVRLLPDGSLDPGFTLGASPALPAGATFSATLRQPDGKVLVTGSFTSFGGVAAPTGVVRLTSTGAVDASFQPATSLAPLVPLAALPDGCLLVRATSQFGTARLLRLLADGAVDATFAPVTLSVAGFATPNWNVVLQPSDGKPVLYGDFEAVNGTQRVGLARLSAAAPLASRSASGADLVLSVYPNPAHGSVTLKSGTALAPGSEVQLLDCLGREVRRQPVPVQTKQLAFPLVGLPPGLYLLQCGAATKRLFVE